MSSKFSELRKKGLLASAPSFIKDNVVYEVLTGSMAYGNATDNSDWDIYGVCIPPKRIVFPHSNGVVIGFDKDYEKFNQFVKHGVFDQYNGREYDFTMFNIVKSYSLCADNNPNMLDTLFVPHHCVLHSNNIGQHIRESRHKFLSKKAWHTFKGYAFGQLKKAKSQNREGKRKEIVDKYGYDTKFASHIVRLIGEVEQILEEGDLDLLRNKEIIKSVRRGDWTFHQIEQWFIEKEVALESLYHKSDLPHKPNMKEIKKVLLECLDMHWQDVYSLVQQRDGVEELICELNNLNEKFQRCV